MGTFRQHREEEEDNEAGRPPGPRYGAGRGQEAAADAIEVEGAGHDNGNVPGNTLGGISAYYLGRVNFSPGIRTSTGRGEQKSGHR